MVSWGWGITLGTIVYIQCHVKKSFKKPFIPKTIPLEKMKLFHKHPQEVKNNFELIVIPCDKVLSQTLKANLYLTINKDNSLKMYLLKSQRPLCLKIYKTCVKNYQVV